MEYVPPPGDPPGSPYVDGNRSAGLRGSVVPAAAIEHPQRELYHLIDYAGLVPAKADLEQVRKAIQALIAAATGGGDTSQFVLMTQARARLPIFPEVQTADGTIGVTTPAIGQVRVPNAVTFLHRGIFPITTAQQDFATAANKTYHLRWTPTGGFVLKDLADVAYNPLVAAETSPAFDTTYDDMLVARVVTNAANACTITRLVNRDRLRRVDILSGNVTNPGINTSTFVFSGQVNFARTPDYIYAVHRQLTDGPQPVDRDIEMPGGLPVMTRYGFSASIINDYLTTWQIRLMTVA